MCVCVCVRVSLHVFFVCFLNFGGGLNLTQTMCYGRISLCSEVAKQKSRPLIWRNDDEARECLSVMSWEILGRWTVVSHIFGGEFSPSDPCKGGPAPWPGMSRAITPLAKVMIPIYSDRRGPLCGEMIQFDSCAYLSNGSAQPSPVDANHHGFGGAPTAPCGESFDDFHCWGLLCNSDGP